MGWSTRQLAELAGTTVRAVRHYHDVALLDEPVRRTNGYKRYGVEHLVRVLRIKRLSDLGFSLAQIAGMGDADEYPDEALRALDTELAESIERLQRVRLELALMRRRSVPADLPHDVALATADADLSDADRSLVVVMTRLLGPAELETYTELLHEHRAGPADAEFDRLPADSDEQTRRDLAERMAEPVRELIAARPGLSEGTANTPHGARFTARALTTALDELYNPAQRDVQRRVARAVYGAPREEAGAAG